MEFIGVDLSLTKTGVCALNESGKHVEALITTSRPEFADRWQRYREIADRICSFIQGGGGFAEAPPKFIVVEDYIVQARNIMTTIHLIEAGSVVRNRLSRLGYPFMTVVGSQLKKWILSSGHGEKSLIMKTVFKPVSMHGLGIDVDDDNLADAVVLAHIARDVHQWKHYGTLPQLKYRAEVIKKVLKDRETINPEKWLK